MKSFPENMQKFINAPAEERLRIMEQIGNTPLEPVYLVIQGIPRKIYLKLEGSNPTGSMKARTAYALLMSGVAGEIVLISRDRERVEGHVKDLRDAALYSHPTRIVAGDFTYCGTADVIIVAVGVPQHKDARSRLDDLKSSATIVKDVMTNIARHAPTGVVVIATNPVDVLTYAAWKWSGLPAGRVIGSGTILDSSRFRRRVGERYGIARRTSTPMWSASTATARWPCCPPPA